MISLKNKPWFNHGKTMAYYNVLNTIYKIQNIIDCTLKRNRRQTKASSEARLKVGNEQSEA